MKEKYNWNLQDIFENEEQFKKEKGEIADILEKIKTYQGILCNTSENLYNCYKLYEQALEKFEKIYAYGMLKYHLDMSNQEGIKIFKEVEGIGTEFSVATSFMTPEITYADENTIKEYIKEERFNSYQKVTLDNLFSQIAQGEMKELPIIVKADVQGSAEAVKQSLEKISNDEVRVKVIHAAVGAINKSDVMLASASNAIIIGFNVRPDATAKRDAEQNNVELRLYRVIYDAINDVKDAMKGMLAPKFREVELGQAEVRSVYKISSVGTIAGCYVKSGKVARNAKIRLVRDGIVITEDEIASLRRFKDDVKEVQQNFECGIGLEKYQDIKEGDIFESFIIEEYREE